MTIPVNLHGALATHRRGKVLQEALAAKAVSELPGGGVVLMFAESFQNADEREQSRLVDWTRTPGRLLLLMPPFATAGCERPVPWLAERLDSAPRGGDGLTKVLAQEAAHRLTGRLQTPALPGATWSDLSVALGTYRVHPASGLFAVTSLPLWSLAALDAVDLLEGWLERLAALAGESPAAKPLAEKALSADHYGFLVFLMSRAFGTEDEILAALRVSAIFRFSPDRGRLLLKDLRDRGLVGGAVPTAEAQELVMRSPYAHYVGALREVANR